MVTTVHVYNQTELLQALKKQIDQIILTDELAQLARELSNQQLTSTERLGTDLGSGGMSSLTEHILNRVFHSYQGATKEETQLNERIHVLYNIQTLDNETVMLRLKQLDY
ncbi:hypothetical protein DOK78_001068 [Enterococcus sp. DIV2402]|uniref:Uncharacterized protein n=1 Tax=Candidatus Enterococcus lowellii TaxID=2230877 RepID=A0ABZ2SKR7_9ENTE|nr:hypothetical protein [Enterococcus sp. DIV2402]MBO0464727.1 hypothetical protein [Enterococcus sp. DIV2402]